MNISTLETLTVNTPDYSRIINSHRIPQAIRDNVVAYLQDGYAQALHCDYAYGTFHVSYITHVIEAVRIGNSVFFMIDSGSYLDFQMARDYIYFLLS